jgi:hypothetical protein
MNDVLSLWFQDAKRARVAMTDKEFHGRRIRVDFSISKGPHQRTPGDKLFILTPCM